jgi:hypothetical protein
MCDIVLTSLWCQQASKVGKSTHGSRPVSSCTCMQCGGSSESCMLMSVVGQIKIKLQRSIAVCGTHRPNMMKSLGTSYSCGKSIGGLRRQRSYRGAYLGPRRFDDDVQLVGGRQCFLANGRWRSANVGRGEKYNLLHQRFSKLGVPLAVVLVCFAQEIDTYI